MMIVDLLLVKYRFKLTQDDVSFLLIVRHHDQW